MMPRRQRDGSYLNCTGQRIDGPEVSPSSPHLHRELAILRAALDRIGVEVNDPSLCGTCEKPLRSCDRIEFSCAGKLARRALRQGRRSPRT